MSTHLVYILCIAQKKRSVGVNVVSKGGSFSNLEGASNFFGNHNTPKVVNRLYNPCCGARHLPASTALLGICRPRPLAQVAPPATGGAPIAPLWLSYIFLLYRCCRHPKAPLCKGGWQKSLISDWGIVILDTLQSLRHGLRRATSLCTREAFRPT